MLRRQMGLTEKINDKTIQEQPTDKQSKNKIASLAPYIAEIERRKKIRSISKRSKKNLNQSSSKSFRIKEKSVTSLQKELYSKTKEIVIGNHNNKREDRGNRERKAKSVQKQHDFQYSKTIQNKPLIGKAATNNNFFNDLYARVKSKLQKERGKEKEREEVHPKEIESIIVKDTQGVKVKEKDRQLRRKQYETLQNNRTRSQQTGELNMYKISYTNVTNINANSKREKQAEQKKTNQKKTNFRRNKYQALHSSVTGNKIESEAVSGDKECNQSDSRVVLAKKQSNLTINIEMDKIAQRQMQNFYQQVLTKQIHRSIEKSTEKYFNYQSYRPNKSKNDIQIYLSTLTNPSMHKVSKSTNQPSERTKQKLISSLQQVLGKQSKNELMEYDFDFKNQEQGYMNMNERQNVELQEQCFKLKAHDDFEKQRRQVEVEYFNKPHPHLNWSDDDCKVDQI